MTTKVFSIFSLLCLCSMTYSVRQDYPWTVILTISSESTGPYEGELELLFVFEDKSQHSVVLPKDKYFPILTNTYQIRLTSPGPVDALYLRTKGFCPLGLLPNSVLRLSKIELVSKTTNVAYTKQVTDLAIKDSCQANSQGTQITNFDQDTVSNCVIDGETHDHGHHFEMGCMGRCDCYNGSVACVPMCGVQSWEPEEKCHFVHVPGQCCDDIVCEKDPKTKVCEEAKPGNVVTQDNKPIRRYPWSVLYCINEKCSQIYGAIILSEKHLLTFAPDLSYLKQLYVSSGQYIVDQANISDFSLLHLTNVSAHPDFVNHDSPFADSASRLQLVELGDPLKFDRYVQAANLPFDNDHCQQLSKNDCPIMTVGWDRTDESDDEFRQWFLHADKSQRDERLCKSNATKPSVSDLPQIVPKRRGEKRACVGGMSRSDCTGPLAGAVIANAASIDFVVGLADPDSALFFCDHAGTADVLPLCKYVDWINALIM